MLESLDVAERMSSHEMDSMIALSMMFEAHDSVMQAVASAWRMEASMVGGSEEALYIAAEESSDSLRCTAGLTGWRERASLAQFFRPGMYMTENL